MVHLWGSHVEILQALLNSDGFSGEAVEVLRSERAGRRKHKSRTSQALCTSSILPKQLEIQKGVEKH
jgi:hypothetical protein